MKYKNEITGQIIESNQLGYYHGNLCLPTPEILSEMGFVELVQSVEIVELTPAQQRQLAYETEPIISWQGEMLTCDEARLNRLSAYYYSNQTEKLQQLQALWLAARTEIQNRYPEII